MATALSSIKLDQSFMISFFRGALRSPLVLGLFGLILVAFVITGVNSPSDLGALATGDKIASIGSQSVSVEIGRAHV